ncbi:hypothetical protein BE20_04695 [Sorangium cellulosum]|nr:hypothetical protein BE20_04695 [Sorangium cellulosum]
MGVDVLLHDVYDTEVTWHVLLSRPDWTFALHDTGICRICSSARITTTWDRHRSRSLPCSRG